jgi:hypothetical protein
VAQPAGNLVLIGEASSPHHAWVVGAIESAVADLYSWLYSRMDIPGAREAVLLIDGTKPCPKDADRMDKHPPFLGLPSYLPKKHARWMGWIAAARAERAAQRL